MIQNKTHCGAVVGSKRKKYNCFLSARRAALTAAGPALLPLVLWDHSLCQRGYCPVPAFLLLSLTHLPLLSSPLTMLLEMIQ
ncbi:unnamed protein product, partial [Bubo scandiacus]